MYANTRRVLVYDGYCNVCSGWARFLEKHQAPPPFTLVAMQSGEGSALLVAHGADPEDPATFLVVDGDRVFRESDGVIHVVSVLGGLWRGLAVGRLVPKALRDWMYRVVARNRYRWFGRRRVCYLPGGQA